MLGVTSSPFLLNATLQYHMEKFGAVDPTFAEQFLHCIYVDNLVLGAPMIIQL